MTSATDSAKEAASWTTAADPAPASIERLGGEFNTNRMVREYVETMYLPAHRARSALSGATM